MKFDATGDHANVYQADLGVEVGGARGNTRRWAMRPFADTGGGIRRYDYHTDRTTDIVQEGPMLIVATLLATQLIASEPHPKHKTSVPDSSDMTLVEVQNNRNVPVTVYAQDSWGEVKLGVVGADSEATFQVKPAITLDGDVDFFVHPQGQQTEDTGNVELRRGDRLAIVVPEKH